MSGSANDREVAREYRAAVDAARRRREAAERDIERLVAEARFAGVPWAALADALGVSKQAAQQRYGR